MKKICKVLFTAGMILTVMQSEDSSEYFLHEDSKKTREYLLACDDKEAIFTVLKSYAQAISYYTKIVASEMWMEAITDEVMEKYPDIVDQVFKEYLDISLAQSQNILKQRTS